MHLLNIGNQKVCLLSQKEIDYCPSTVLSEIGTLCTVPMKYISSNLNIDAQAIVSPNPNSLLIKHNDEEYGATIDTNNNNVSDLSKYIKQAIAFYAPSSGNQIKYDTADSTSVYYYIPDNTKVALPEQAGGGYCTIDINNIEVYSLANEKLFDTGRILIDAEDASDVVTANKKIYVCLIIDKEMSFGEISPHFHNYTYIHFGVGEELFDEFFSQRGSKPYIIVPDDVFISFWDWNETN